MGEGEGNVGWTSSLYPILTGSTGLYIMCRILSRLAQSLVAPLGDTECIFKGGTKRKGGERKEKNRGREGRERQGRGRKREEIIERERKRYEEGGRERKREEDKERDNIIIIIMIMDTVMDIFHS